jgi:hypothetical protein
LDKRDLLKKKLFSKTVDFRVLLNAKLRVVSNLRVRASVRTPTGHAADTRRTSSGRNAAAPVRKKKKGEPKPAFSSLVLA